MSRLDKTILGLAAILVVFAICAVSTEANAWQLFKWQGEKFKILGSCVDGDENVRSQTNACITTPGTGTGGPQTICCDEWDLVETCVDGDWHFSGIENAKGCDGDLGDLAK